MKTELDLEYWIGQNAQDNWNSIGKANPHDLWFHLDSHPSAHVILRLPDGVTSKDLSPQTLAHCGYECKANSKLAKVSDKQKVSIIYTEIQNLTLGSDVGSVYTKKEKYIKI